MNQNYSTWLAEQKYAENTQTAQIHRVKKVEDTYGSLDDHFKNGTYQEVIDALTYSTDNERANKPNPSKIQFDGNIRNNLQSYKNAVVRDLQEEEGGKPVRGILIAHDFDQRTKSASRVVSTLTLKNIRLSSNL